MSVVEYIEQSAKHHRAERILAIAAPILAAMHVNHTQWSPSASDKASEAVDAAEVLLAEIEGRTK